MKVMGVDPGVTTGVAHVELDPEELLVNGTNEWIIQNSDRIVLDEYGPKEKLSEIESAWAIANIYHWVDVVVVEDFILYGGDRFTKDRKGLAPVRVTSHLEAFHKAYTAVNKVGWYGSLWKQWKAADAKRMVNDAKLRELGLWKPGKAHARDAARLLVLGLRAI